MNQEYIKFHSLLGDIIVISHIEHIIGVYFSNSKYLPPIKNFILNPENRILAQAKTQILAFVENNRHTFDIKYSFKGTKFQKQVWNAIVSIPYGHTMSYSEIASMIGRPKAYRAIGSAVGRNPILIIIPCHRVLRADNSLGGYVAGEKVKRKILSLEKKESRASKAIEYQYLYHI